jgi:hypothetical protein
MSIRPCILAHGPASWNSLPTGRKHYLSGLSNIPGCTRIIQLSSES